MPKPFHPVVVGQKAVVEGKNQELRVIQQLLFLPAIDNILKTIHEMIIIY